MIPAMVRGLRGLLLKQDIHPDVLAEKLKVHRTTVYAWISGRSTPREWRSEQIAEVLGVDQQAVRKALEESARSGS